MIKLTLHLLLLFVITSCSSNNKQTAGIISFLQKPEYSEEKLWYISHNDIDDSDSINVDIFYITPTCVFDWKDDKTNQICHHYDVYRKIMKDNFDYSLQLAENIFAEECNFYSPYYRQISLESWLEEEDVIEQRFEIAMDDIENAFEHYFKHQNKGRSFILAGYSQGAKAVIELIKKLDKSSLAQMVAAYAIGYRITEDDLKNSNIKLAHSSDDTGVVICYNSVRGINDIWDAVSAGNVACINPVNWHIDNTKAMLNDSISVQIESTKKVLIIDGYDGGGIQIPLLNGIVSEGNYHLSELTLFREHLRKNVKDRIAAF